MSFIANFFRYLLACRSVWAGLPTFIQEKSKDVVNPCLNSDIESPELIVSHLPVKACFNLTDPQDPRYRKAEAHKLRFGDICRKAAGALRHGTESEDHIDAVIAVMRSIDVYLLDYGLGKAGLHSLQKSYTQARE